MKTRLKLITFALAVPAIVGCADLNTPQRIAGSATASTPMGSPEEADDLAAYQRAGFVVKMDDGRLWVFREGAPELADFETHGELAKHVIRPAAGPGRITLKSPDIETLNASLNNELAPYQRAGFVVKMEDGRLWVFREGAPELADFETHGELAKHVIRPAAGPGRITLKSPDTETIEAYLNAQ